MEKAKVRRSRNGCSTCRARHVRCDETLPLCGACTRLRLECSYTPKGTQEQAARKGADARHARFRVRFVDPRPAKTPEASAHHSPPSPPERVAALSSSPSLGSQSLEHGSSPTLQPPMTTPSPAEGCTVEPPLVEEFTAHSSNSAPLAYDASPEDQPFVPAQAREAWDHLTLQGGMDMLLDQVPVFDEFQAVGFEEMIQTTDAFLDAQALAIETPETAASPLSEVDIPVRGCDARSTVSIRPEDREPLQHYLSTMVQFVKLRSSASDDIYCYMFTNMSLTYAPLYEAILAWAALHLAHVKSRSPRDAEKRYQQASALLYDDLEAAEHVNLTLATVWFLLQYELFSGTRIDRFISLLNYVADVIEIVFRDGKLDIIKEQLGPAAVRVLIWLSAYEGRAAPLGHTCRLLRCLKAHPFVYDIIEYHAKETSVSSTGAANRLGSTELTACLRLSLRLNIVWGSCKMLPRWEKDSVARETSWPALGSSIAALQKEVTQDDFPAARLAMRIADGDMDAPTALTTLEQNWVQLLSTFYACAISFLENKPTSSSCDGPGTDVSAHTALLPTIPECAARIIRLARHTNLSRPNSSPLIWPQILFSAGLGTTDPIYQSWVSSSFAQAEPLGPNIKKARLLLERIIRLRREVKAPLDMLAVMNGMGGPFII